MRIQGSDRAATRRVEQPARRRTAGRRGPDEGVVDVISNILLVSMTVVLAVALGGLILWQVQPGDSLNASFRMDGDTDQNTLRVAHTGGEPVSLQTGAIWLVLDGTQTRFPLTDCLDTASDDPSQAGNPDLWQAGERLYVNGHDHGCGNFAGQKLTDARLVLSPGGESEDVMFAAWRGELAGLNPTGNTGPLASFTHNCIGLACTFDASASSDPDGSITQWDWAFGDGDTGSGETTTHTYSSDGTYTVELTVTDDSGATDTETETVTVSNAAPVAAFTWTPLQPYTGETVTFDASLSTDPDGTIDTYEWDLDDDGLFDDATGQTTTHSFSSAGDHDVHLRVTDDKGASDTVTQTVSVTDPVYTYVDCPFTVNAGTASDCTNAQSDSDNDAVASLTETSAGGSTNKYSLEIDASFSGVPLGDQELQIRYRLTGGDAESMTVDVWDGSNWNTHGTLDAISFTTFTSTLTAAEYNSGSPEVRFSDSNNDGTQTTIEIDHLRVRTT